ncbi:MAG: hypothetical protein ACRD3S_02885, partial [Terracidiphilus sp.]
MFWLLTNMQSRKDIDSSATAIACSLVEEVATPTLDRAAKEAHKYESRRKTSAAFGKTTFLNESVTLLTSCA